MYKCSNIECRKCNVDFIIDEKYETYYTFYRIFKVKLYFNGF